MTYPAITSFKQRALSISSSSTGTAILSVTVPFRAKYLYSVANYTPLAGGSAAWAMNLSVNGSTTTADAVVSNPFINSTTTSTAAVPGGFNSSTSNTATLFLNQGDVLTTVGSSQWPMSIVHIVQEF